MILYVLLFLDLSNKPNIIEAAITKMIPSHNNIVKCKLMRKPPKFILKECIYHRINVV